MNIKIHARACIIQSVLKTEVIKKLQKFAPKALVSTDPESKEPVFAIGVDSCGSVGAYGISFNDTAVTGEAQVTLILPDKVKNEDRQQWVLDNFGLALSQLDQAEHRILAEYNTLAATFAAVEDNITVD